jgi:hypothetical protein
MKKLEAGRSRMKAARLAKASKARQPPNIPPPVSIPRKIEVAPQRTNILTKTKLAWRRLKTWQKIAAPVIPVLASIYSSLPNFSVSRETTNPLAPYSGEFLFKNEGWLPATRVSTQCTISTLMGGPVSIAVNNLKTQNYIGDVIWGRGEFTRGCHISDSRITPMNKGSLKISVVYSYPFIPREIVSSPANFSFRYDSQSGGFVFVPDVLP